MEIRRDFYLQKLVDRRENGSVKIITGIRRCGKSYLLFEIYYRYLLNCGIDPSRIVRIALDEDGNEDLLTSKALGSRIRELTPDDRVTYYVFLDEIQYVEGFERVLNGLDRRKNLDVYVTGSNSKFLSTDVLTIFRGRGDEVRVRPLSFSEYLPAHGGSPEDAWEDYSTYGGMPLILSRRGDEAKASYLASLMSKVYLDDIVDRHGLKGDEAIGKVVDVLASSVGSLTNPVNLAKTFQSKGYGKISDKTVRLYIDYLAEAFLVDEVSRYDIKGRKYIGSPLKYYFTDIGLRNSRLNFRQQEENHIMENAIFNELLVRGFNVDVGVVKHEEKDAAGKRVLKNLEIDFVCNKGSNRYYIQSAFAIPDDAKMKQEQKSLTHVPDSFRKIIVVRNRTKPWHNDEGILIVGLLDFLNDASLMDA